MRLRAGVQENELPPSEKSSECAGPRCSVQGSSLWGLLRSSFRSAMFIATKPPPGYSQAPEERHVSVGDGLIGRVFVTKKHAAPPEPGQAIEEAVPIHMALLTELFALPTSSLVDVKD